MRATANTMASVGWTAPVTSGRFRVRCMSRSMSRSTYMFSALAPPAAIAPPATVAAISHSDGSPRSARIIEGTVVTSSNSTMRGFVSATKAAARARRGAASVPVTSAGYDVRGRWYDSRQHCRRYSAARELAVPSTCGPAHIRQAHAVRPVGARGHRCYRRRGAPNRLGPGVRGLADLLRGPLRGRPRVPRPGGVREPALHRGGGGCGDSGRAGLLGAAAQAARPDRSCRWGW